ncbi:MAG: HAMP domain-containing histidine kinase [Pontiellaceae bacterium]|nr:HAMP domain-containing histidine kinase [Pontiellaceae bacterium]MBN2783857.1 HAMP domain-containing histidine kinase [Pontiellaceae bacterium]
MGDRSILQRSIPETRLAFVTGLLVALGILAVTVAFSILFLRGLVREQIIRRDAEALHATTLMEQLDAVTQGETDPRSDEQVGFDGAIRASRLKGVMGIRFYDVDGRFSDAVPATILPLPLSEREQAAVSRLTACGRFKKDTLLSSVFIYLPQFSEGKIRTVPILEVTVPLHRRETDHLAGIAQFIIEGQGIEDEFIQLDRRLAGLGAAVFGVGGILLVFMLWPTFRRIQNLNRAITERGERLQRANEELALAARASAVGAVSAHLMHGLKNPLASLSQYVSHHGADGDPSDQDEWQDALSASRRMQQLVEQTLEVLGDIRGEPAYEVTIDELFEDLKSRVTPMAERNGVHLCFNADAFCRLSSRTVNLSSLVLVNLLENAIGATPSGGSVSLSLDCSTHMLCFHVRDEGNGFPDHLLDQLFLPCRSTHEGGSGIGLAISKQVADHMGGRLTLEFSTTSGCSFLLEIPEEECLDAGI